MTRRLAAKEKQRTRLIHPHAPHRIHKRPPEDTNSIWYNLSRKWFRNAES